MNIGKRFVAVVAALCLLSSINAQSHLPLAVGEEQFNDNSIFISKDNVEWTGGLIQTNDDWTNNGWGAFTIAFQDVPGMLTLQYIRNSYGKNNELGLQESPNNEDWTDLYVGNPPTSWTDFSVMLKPETRYVRFWYKAEYKFGDFGPKYAEVRNMNITKAIHTDVSSLSFEVEPGSSDTKEFDLSVSNLKGDLAFDCSNPDFRVELGEMSSSGSVTVTVTYTPTEAVSAEAVLTIKDAAYEANNETIALSGAMLPSVPTVGEATEVAATSFVANWQNVADFTTLLTVMQDGAPLDGYADLECQGFSHVVEGLQPGVTYTYQVKAKSGGTVTEPSDVATVTLPVPSVEMKGFEPFVTTAGAPVSQAVGITAANLVGDVALSLKYGEVFTLDTDILGADEADGAVVEVSYSPVAVGEDVDTLFVTTDYATALSIPLRGVNSLEAPVALEAENVTNSGFTARWEAVDGATDYRLTVMDAAGTPLNIYNGIATGDVTSYVVTNLLPSTTYLYAVRSEANGAVSADASDEISVTTADGAVITYSHTPKDFVTVRGASVAQSIRVSGSNVFGAIMAEVTGDESFTIDNPSLPSEGGMLTITFAPGDFGTHAATLSLSASGAESVNISLNGTATPARVEALAATEVGTGSFTANWQKVDGAQSYLLTVRRANQNLAGWDDVELGDVASHTVDGLDEAVTYNYSVKAVAAGAEGEASAFVAATTLYTPVLEVVSTAETSASVVWNAPYAADAYSITLKQNGTAVEGYDGVHPTAAAYTFTALEPSTRYDCELTTTFGEVTVQSETVTFTTAAASTAYGNQLHNSGFEEWEGSGDTFEPVDWNSFGTLTGDYASMASMAGVRMEQSTDVRPGTSGSKSVRVWTGSVLGVKANGNLTTGRINAGSITATDPANYNFTVTDDEAFSERINARPDSLTVWVKYTAANSASKARVAAIIHDNYSYRDPSGSDPNADSHVVGSAEMNFPSNGGGWQRLSVPFNYRGNELSPDFMLVTFSSNMTPGGGDANDAVIVDDLHLVYKPVLTVSPLAVNAVKAGDVLVVDYELTGSMSVPNIAADRNTVSLQLSDANGSFASPHVLATITTDKSGKLVGTVPEGLEPGGGYKVRVVTTNYPMTAEARGTLTVSGDGVPVISASFDQVLEAQVGVGVAQAQMSIGGENLAGEIFLDLSSDVFTVSPTVLPATGGTVTVTYAPRLPGDDEARLVISSVGAEDVALTLRGRAELPVAVGSVIADGTRIGLWPNPVVDIVTLDGVEDDAPFCIYSLDGRMAMAGKLQGVTADLSGLPRGAYVMVVANTQVKFIK